MTDTAWLASYPKSGMFPAWDLMFGTFHMPAGRRPEIFGADGVPEGLFSQLAHPFATWGRSA
jgi:sterol desaturase/sphingolipid hydroxylase (fatty acid hydroxylase superfamily)